LPIQNDCSLAQKKRGNMKVMTNHSWFDDDVKCVDYDPGGGQNPELRSLIFKDSFEGELLIHKNDVVALAKEFDLVIYEKDSNL
jgi:hypothetical protein